MLSFIMLKLFIFLLIENIKLFENTKTDSIFTKNKLIVKFDIYFYHIFIRDIKKILHKCYLYIFIHFSSKYELQSQ